MAGRRAPVDELLADEGERSAQAHLRPDDAHALLPGEKQGGGVRGLYIARRSGRRKEASLADMGGVLCASAAQRIAQPGRTQPRQRSVVVCSATSFCS